MKTEMKRKIQVINILFIIIFLILCSCSKKNYKDVEIDNWNHGYCEIDNGRLNYIGTNNKEIYMCEKCGKKYKFDKLMTYDK